VARVLHLAVTDLLALDKCEMWNMSIYFEYSQSTVLSNYTLAYHASDRQYYKIQKIKLKRYQVMVGGYEDDRRRKREMFRTKERREREEKRSKKGYETFEKAIQSGRHENKTIWI
jgi:hypothetical protein